jgi:mannan endo-1,4-beta-mannosidase
MSIIGTNVKLPQGNFIFEQDPKVNWAKINNVVLGEQHMYGYQTFNSKDIGALLDMCYKDNNIVAVVYDWVTGNAFCKTGFNLNVQGDYLYKQNYTSFVVKSRVPNSSLPQPPQPQPPKPQPPKPNSSFVTWNGSKFILNNTKFDVVGPNIYWLGLTEEYTYPSHQLIEQMFIVASKMSSTVIRSHTLGHSSGSKQSLLENPNAWESIDFAFTMAAKYNIKLICPLTDNYWWYNGNYGDYCSKRGIRKEMFWTDPNVRSDFKKYINTWLNHTNRYTGIKIKDDPNLFMIELGNELGNIRTGPDGVQTTVPTREWISDISQYIKTIDTNHLVLSSSDECLGSNQTNDFAISTIDAFSAHFYGEDYNRLDTGAWKASNLKKPYIIGEYASNFPDNFYYHIEANPNVSGSIFWDLYPQGIIHNDGSTLYYGDPGSTEYLLRITNHHRRIRNLPTITQLP